MNKKLLVSVLVTFGLVLVVYAGILNRIQKAFIERDFEKTEKLILKSLEKDSLNPGARYYYSRLFLDEGFGRYDIDSASLFMEAALDDYHQANADVFEELGDAGITLEQLLQHRSVVAQVAFDRADTINTVNGWDYFREHFSHSDLMTDATYRRDSLAFEETQTEHKWEAYKTYFETYPNSPFVDRARDHYQTLLFQDYTKDDRTESYIQFLVDYPMTPFRARAEEIIFRRTTRSNNKSDYIKFIRRYPNSHLVKKAADIAYYLSESGNEIDREVYLVHPLVDSLREIHELNRLTLFPTYNKAAYGFLNTLGEEVLPSDLNNISDSYLCGNVSDNWLQITEDGVEQLISRRGEVIVSDIARYSSISPSLKLVFTQEPYLYHASGYKILPNPVEEASLLGNHWIKYKYHYSWGLCLPTGEVILDPLYESIDMVGPFVVIENKEGNLAATTKEILLADSVNLAFSFDDYELIQDSLLQVFNKDQEGVMNADLHFLVPMDTQEVYISGEFWYIDHPDYSQVINHEDSVNVTRMYQRILVNDGWTAYKDESWELISRDQEGAFSLSGLDSVKLLNEFAAYVSRGDTLDLLFQNNERVPLTRSNELSVFARPNGKASYLSIQDGNEYKLIDQYSNLLFLGDFDELILISDSLFKYKYQGKTGVKRADGSRLIAPEYDVIDEEAGLLFLLKEGKIGCYDLTNGALIPAEYGARIKRINDSYLVVKDGFHGMVNPANKKVISFSYDEIVEWNDTSMWVRKGLDWSLINLDEEVIVDQIQSVRKWIEVNDEQLALVSGEDGFGVYGNFRGQILPVQYNEIINVGSSTEPVFFAEQHLKAAALFVVTYFNAQGEVINSIPYRPEEYDRIYCDD